MLKSFSVKCHWVAGDVARCCCLNCQAFKISADNEPLLCGNTPPLCLQRYYSPFTGEQLTDRMEQDRCAPKLQQNKKCSNSEATSASCVILGFYFSARKIGICHEDIKKAVRWTETICCGPVLFFFRLKKINGSFWWWWALHWCKALISLQQSRTESCCRRQLWAVIFSIPFASILIITRCYFVKPICIEKKRLSVTVVFIDWLHF